MKERTGSLRKPKVQKHVENLPKSIPSSVSQIAKGIPFVASLATFICERKLKLPVLAYLFQNKRSITKTNSLTTVRIYRELQETRLCWTLQTTSYEGRTKNLWMTPLFPFVLADQLQIMQAFYFVLFLFCFVLLLFFALKQLSWPERRSLEGVVDGRNFSPLHFPYLDLFLKV